MSIRLLRAGRRPTANASIFVGEYGSIFYAENTGTLRISDGVTPGGQPLQLVASDFSFSFGDFVATTPSDGSASLSSKQTNQDINIYSNGTGSVHLIGNVAIYAPDGNIYTRSPSFEVNNDGQVRILVSNSDPTAGALEIIGSSSGQLYPPVNAGVMLHITGQNGQNSRLYNDGVGAPAAFVGRRINNTIVSPQAVVAGDDIIRISSTGYNGSTVPGSGSARITYYATENWTNTNFGGNIAFSVTNNGSTTLTEVANVSYTNGVSSKQLSTTGNIKFISNNVTTNGFNKTGGTATANGVTGQLTSLADLLAKGSAGTFTVNNTYVSSKDVVIVNIASGASANSYDISVTAVSNGSFQVTVTNNGSGGLSEALVINFAVIKVT